MDVVTNERFASFDELADAHAALQKAVDTWCGVQSHADDADPESEFVSAHLSEVQTFVARAAATGALLRGLDERRPAQHIIDRWITALYRVGVKTRTSAVLAPFDLAAAPDLADKACPYKGLDAYTGSPYDVDRFYGRDERVDALLKQVVERRFVFVTGPSGSGKSSLVLAGLIPRLQCGSLPGSETWKYLPTILPGAAPLASLAKALVDAGLAKDAPALAETLATDARALTRLLDQSGSPCVLLIDQFEEIFTLRTADTAARTQSFIDALLAIAKDPSSKHRIIATFRRDREGDLANYGELYNLYFEKPFIVSSMKPEQLRDAIELPAKRVGLVIESDVVDELVTTFAGDETGLPLLQYCLVELWDAKERNRITRKALDALGDPREAMGKVADAVYAKLIPEKKVATKQIFLLLARKGEGVEFLRARRTRGELWTAVGNKETVDQVLEKFVEKRLLRLTPSATGDAANDVLEVAHEALLRNWLQFREWTVEEGDRLDKRRFVARQAALWSAKAGASRSDGGLDATGLLLSGISLDEAMATVYDDFPAASNERRFLDASQRNAREVENRLVRAAEAAKNEASWLRVRNRGKNAIIGLVFLVTTLVAFVALLLYKTNEALKDERDTAVKQDHELRAQRLGDVALQKCESDPQLATRLAHESLIKVPLVRDTFVHNAIAAAYCLMRSPQRTVKEIAGRRDDEHTAMTLAADGATLAVGLKSGKVYEWTLGSGIAERAAIDEPPGPEAWRVSQLSYGRDGTYLAAVYRRQKPSASSDATGAEDRDDDDCAQRKPPCAELVVWKRGADNQFTAAARTVTGDVQRLEWSRDGSQVAIVSEGSTGNVLQIFNVEAAARNGRFASPDTFALKTPSPVQLIAGDSDAGFVVVGAGETDLLVQRFKPKGDRYEPDKSLTSPMCPNAQQVFAAGSKRLVRHFPSVTCVYEWDSKGAFSGVELPDDGKDTSAQMLDVAIRGHGKYIVGLAGVRDGSADVVIRGLDDAQSYVLPKAFDVRPDCDDADCDDLERFVRVSDDGRTIAVKRRNNRISIHQVSSEPGIGWSSRLFRGRALLTPDEQYLAVLQPGASKSYGTAANDTQGEREYTIHLRSMADGKTKAKESFTYSGNLQLMMIDNAGTRFLTYDPQQKKLHVWAIDGGSVRKAAETASTATITRPLSGAFAATVSGRPVCYTLQAPESPVAHDDPGRCALSADGKLAMVRSKDGSKLVFYGLDGKPTIDTRVAQADSILIGGDQRRFVLAYDRAARENGERAVKVSEVTATGIVSRGQFTAALGTRPSFAFNVTQGWILAREGDDVVAHSMDNAAQVVWREKRARLLDGAGRFVSVRDGDDTIILPANNAYDRTPIPGLPTVTVSAGGEWLAARYNDHLLVYNLVSRTVFADLPFAVDDAAFSALGNFLMVRSSRGLDVVPLRLERIVGQLKASSSTLALTDLEKCSIENDSGACDRVKSERKDKS